MSRPLASVSEQAFAYIAIGRMNRLWIRHLGVTDAAGDVVGVLSTRDVLKLRAEGALELGDEIDAAADLPELAYAWGKLADVVAALVSEGLSTHDIAAVISYQLCEMTRRAAALAEIRMKETGHGDPPCPYAFMVLGSAGRGESLLAMDQDNALVFADDKGSETDPWFAALARHVADILHQAGVPYCKGRVMAKEPQWRGSLSDWRQRVDGWIRRSNPEDLLAVDIFFDLRHVHGNSELVESLGNHAFDAAQGQASFAKLLVEANGNVEPSRTWFGGVHTSDGRIDLKRSGLLGVVSSVRAIAICNRIVARSTLARIDGIKALGLGSEDDLDALSDAHATFLELILKQQIEDIEKGRALGNSVDVTRLSRRDRRRLRTALRAVEHLDQLTRDLLFKS
jgi:DNA polymerase-3 subunit epsilon/CBS domain-containing protein